MHYNLSKPIGWSSHLRQSPSCREKKSWDKNPYWWGKWKLREKETKTSGKSKEREEPKGLQGKKKKNHYTKPQKKELCIVRKATAAAAAAKSLQSCPTACDSMDRSPPGSPVPEIFQVRTLEWVAISFSNAWKWKVKVKSLSRVRPLATPWTAAHQAPPSMGFSRQEYWSGVPLPSPS